MSERIYHNQLLLEAAILELTLWVAQRDLPHVGDNVLGAPEAIEENAGHIKKGWPSSGDPISASHMSPPHDFGVASGPLTMLDKNNFTTQPSFGMARETAFRCKKYCLDHFFAQVAHDDVAKDSSHSEPVLLRYSYDCRLDANPVERHYPENIIPRCSLHVSYSTEKLGAI